MNDMSRLFTQQIINGDWDDELDAIIEAIVSRRKVRQLESATAFAITDQVMFNDEARAPWCGLTGTVTDKTRSGRIGVTIHEQAGVPCQLRNTRRQIRAGMQWMVPAEWLSRINNQGGS